MQLQKQPYYHETINGGTDMKAQATFRYLSGFIT